jgi:hypothetical protein
MLKKKWVVVLALLIILLSAAGAYYEFVYSGYFPHNVRQQIHISLYYPIKLPAGMHVDRSSFMMPAKNVVTYAIVDKDGNKFYVSEQNLPDNFDFQSFKKKFESSDELIVKAGNAFVGDIGTQLIASVTTPDQSWILITTTDYTAQNELADICRAFVRTR